MQNRSEIENISLNGDLLDKEQIKYLLHLQAPEDRKWIFGLANKVRKKFVGDDIFLRGIIEFSNYCRKSCFYCGIGREIENAHRYRIEADEILEICRRISKKNMQTVVLQSGEDMYYTREKLGEMIRRIKSETGMAVTLSVGVRDRKTYEYWKSCGLDRCLLRFETSNPKIFQKLHPDDKLEKRIEMLKMFKELEIQSGSGFMIGLPGATIDDAANDILLCRELDLDMIGIGPFLPHPDTPLYYLDRPKSLAFSLQVLAVTRLVNQESHIPATTAFDAYPFKGGRQQALTNGANIFMPNVTPGKYREDYQLYPGKACVDETSEQCLECTNWRITSLGRTIGQGKGDSIKFVRRLPKQ